MTQMNLSEEEEQIILKHREEQQANLPYKSGILKHNLYMIDSDNFGTVKIDVSATDGLFCTAKEKNAFVKQFHDKFELIAAGTTFTCYVEEDGAEQWFDDDGIGIEHAPEEWAKKHLKNIKKLR